MVFEKLRDILSSYFDIEKESITMESDFADDFEADSLDLVDLSMSVEDEFSVELPDEMLETVRTVGDVVKTIENLKK